MRQVPKIHGIFPEPIYQSKLGRELTKKELSIIRKFKIKTRYVQFKEAVQNNSPQSSDNYVLENKELKNLKEDLNKIVPAASGSGFFVSYDGHLITNNHVIDNCNNINNDNNKNNISKK